MSKLIDLLYGGKRDSAKGIIRKEIGKQMKLRHVPELTFRIDRSMEYGRHIDEVIKKLEKDNEE